MEKIKIGDKTYKLNIEKAKELGLLEETSTFRISTDYKTGAMIISEWYGKLWRNCWEMLSRWIKRNI